MSCFHYIYFSISFVCHIFLWIVISQESQFTPCLRSLHTYVYMCGLAVIIQITLNGMNNKKKIDFFC